MNLTMFHYMMSGALGGIAGWFVARLLFMLLFHDPYLELILLGAFLSLSTALTISIAMRVHFGASQNILEVVAIIGIGLVLGGGLGFLAALLFQQWGVSPKISRAVVTVLIGPVAGAVAGVNLDDFRIKQVGLTAAGGLVGAILGAMVHALTPSGNDLYFGAVGWTLAMACVGLFAGLLPHIVSQATFRLHSSEHIKTKMKFRNHAWDVQDQDLVIGTHPKLGRAPNILLLDRESISDRHATVRFNKADGYVVERHDDAEQRHALMVDGRPVRERAHLRDGSMLKIGTTVLAFQYKR